MKALCTHLTDGTVVAGFHVVFTFIASVNKAVLALTVQLHQHAHGTPLGPPERAELQVFVPAQGQEGVAAVHKVAGHQRVLVGDGGQRVGRRNSNEADNEEDLEIEERGSAAWFLIQHFHLYYHHKASTEWKLKHRLFLQ